MANIADIPDVIPTDDITQHERTVTSVVVQWKVPNYYNAPITMYSLNLCQKINDVCTPVNGNYPMNINVSDINVIESNRSIVRYVLIMIGAVLIMQLFTHAGITSVVFNLLVVLHIHSVSELSMILAQLISLNLLLLY